MGPAPQVNAHLVLASQSPRRAELLQRAGLDFAQRAADCDESWHPGEAPVAYARRIAEKKAESVARDLGESLGSGPFLILAADTTVWLDEESEPLGKPPTRDAATEMLHAITRPEGHWVTTAYAWWQRSPRGDSSSLLTRHETTQVFMRPLGTQERERYLDTMEWSDKAGGYGIQGHAAAFVMRIDGSYTNVVGLPLAQVLVDWEKLRSPERAHGQHEQSSAEGEHPRVKE